MAWSSSVPFGNSTVMLYVMRDSSLTSLGRDRYSNRMESLKQVALMMMGANGGSEWRKAIISIGVHVIPSAHVTPSAHVIPRYSCDPKV